MGHKIGFLWRILLNEDGGKNRAPDKRWYWGLFKDYFSYFSTKTYVVTPHKKRLGETVLMMGHKIGFYGEIWLIIPKLPLLPLLIWSTARMKMAELLSMASVNIINWTHLSIGKVKTCTNIFCRYSRYKGTVTGKIWISTPTFELFKAYWINLASKRTD